MLFIESSPYIRFADVLLFNKERSPSKTYDCRFLYTVSGSASFSIDRKSCTMRKGSLAIFQPNTEYRFLPDPAIELAIFDFDYTQQYCNTTDFLVPCSVHHYNPAEAHETVLFEDATAFNQPFFHENMQFLESAIHTIMNEFREKKLLYREKNSVRFQDILIDILRHLQLGNSDNNIVDRVMQYIDEHISDAISNRQIGMDLNYNPNYLNRMLLRHTGTSLHQYILQKRLAKAILLLQTTNLPINDIALQLGFNSLAHFSNFFKKETGTAPNAYRHRGIL